MKNERSNNFEYSEALQHAKDAELEAADTDRVIAETRQHIEELKKDRQAILNDTEHERGHGLNEADLIQIDSYIKEAEEAIVDFEKIKAEFLSQAEQLKRIHQKGKELLDEHRPDKIS